MFTKLAYYKAGIIPVRFRQVNCAKRGGVKFEIKGNANWLEVLFYNVGGAGAVSDAKVKGSATGWIQMTRNWGQNWQVSKNMIGQTLSFQLTTSDRKMVEFDGVVPRNWRFGQTFDGRINF